MKIKERIYNHLISGATPLSIWRDMIATLGPERMLRHMLETLHDPLQRKCTWERFEIDSPVENELQFEHMAGLFLNGGINSGIICQSVRQAAYLFHTVRNLAMSILGFTILEIGRYKGGSTFLLASAVNKNGHVISIDNHRRVTDMQYDMGFDKQIMSQVERFGLSVELINADSSTMAPTARYVNAAFIDGDHTYDGVNADIGLSILCMSGKGPHHLFFDDATDSVTGKPTAVGIAVRELISYGEWKMVKQVMRLTHLVRNT